MIKNQTPRYNSNPANGHPKKTNVRMTRGIMDRKDKHKPTKIVEVLKRKQEWTQLNFSSSDHVNNDQTIDFNVNNDQTIDVKQQLYYNNNNNNNNYYYYYYCQTDSRPKYDL